MKRTNTKTTYHTERRLFYVAAASLCILSVAYVYFVSAAVAHVVVRKELSQEIVATQTRISDLEAEYIIAKDSVGMDMAIAHGFEGNSAKVFVTKVSSNMALSLNNERE